MAAAAPDNKNRLIEAALGLFAEHGYDRTGVQAIIDNVGVAKGTFYHYFKSKEELLDGVAEWMVQGRLDDAQSIVDDPSLGAVGKLYLFLESFRGWKMKHGQLLMRLARLMYRPENFALRYRMARASRVLMAPPLAKIIRQGVDEGVFDAPYPEEMAELILNHGLAHGESVAPHMQVLGGPRHAEAVEAIKRFAELYYLFIERMLGIPRDMVRPPDMDWVDVLLDAHKTN